MSRARGPAEQRTDYTETYRDSLMRSLGSLRASWAAHHQRVARGLPPISQQGAAAAETAAELKEQQGGTTPDAPQQSPLPQTAPTAWGAAAAEPAAVTGQGRGYPLAEPAPVPAGAVSRRCLRQRRRHPPRSRRRQKPRPRAPRRHPPRRAPFRHPPLPSRPRRRQSAPTPRPAAKPTALPPPPPGAAKPAANRRPAPSAQAASPHFPPRAAARSPRPRASPSRAAARSGQAAP